MNSKLEKLIRNENLIVCPLINRNTFIQYCNKRGLLLNLERLEQLEKAKLLFPVARVKHPKVKQKVEYTEEGRKYRYLGALQENEVWEGDVREEYASFWFTKVVALPWLENKLLWSPEESEFAKWNTFIDDDGERFITSYYSIFQCYSLWQILGTTSIQINSDDWLFYSEKEKEECCSNISVIAKSQKKRSGKVSKYGRKVAYLCQVISNRYYPKTQTDRRRFYLSKDGMYADWDWYEYCRSWKAQEILEDFKLELDDIKRIQEKLASDAQHIDPLGEWYDLVSFISISQRKRLKNKALLAQELYSMEYMLRLFYKELTGDSLFKPSESASWESDKFYGKGTSDDEMKFLEFLTNQYHLNPKPRLILVVEGESEEKQIPRLVENMFGCSFSKLGIYVMNLHGVSNFSGTKKNDKYGALEKFIDYHHSKNTIVFVVLDNEGLAGKVKKKLLKKRSILNKGRMVTKEEYIHLWERKSIEFSNFSNQEIAKSMSELAEQKDLFTANEIEQAYESTLKKESDSLSLLYKKKTGADQCKPKLLKMLFDLIIEMDSFKAKKEKPVVLVLDRVVALASKNHGPVNTNICEANQHTGYFGDIVEEKKSIDNVGVTK